MKKKLMNNLFLKVISVLIAILLWLVIDNLNDPIITKSYPVPVDIQNSAYIESISKTYRVEEEDQSATVILRGRRSVVEGRINDIQAVADLTQIVDMNTKPYVMVPIDVICKQIPPENIMVVPRNMKLIIEEMESKEFVISVTTSSKPDSDYQIGRQEAAPEKVNIIGPASLIQKIDRVVANVDVSGLKEDIVKMSRLKVYDKNQEGLSDVQMSYLKFMDIGVPEVQVLIDVWKVRQDVALNLDYSGSPGEGYQVEGITITPAKIGVAGTDEALAKLAQTGNVIPIPSDAVVLSGETKDFETKLDLTAYLPQDISLAGDVKSAIVEVSIIPLGSKQFSLLTKNIVPTNLGEGLKVVYATDKVEVRVKGSAEALTQINENTVKPVVNMEGKSAGVYDLPIEFTLPEGCELLESVNVSAEIMKLE